jgi:2-polyprenyl-3-methyl-5-hydroxy-6-metoxy-1,4-benzoquinol methylase
MYATKNQGSRAIRAVGRHWKKWRDSQHYKQLSIKETFSEIYRSKAWGSMPNRPFCSGDGSMREDAVQPYTQAIRNYIEAHGVKHVVDLGCGDFGVGSRLVKSGLRYTGVDVVPDLIDYNQKHFGSDRIEFRCLDIIEDQPPEGDLCLVRQVLQHLSNEQILKTLQSLVRYRRVIVTEHVYAGPGLRRNRDKPQGPGTRIPKRSGVFLESAPFHCPAELLLEIPLAETESLRTVVIAFR